MFKKLLSSLTVMLFAFSMHSEAQQTKTVLSDKPIHKVYVEEFAFMTCGYCPKGIVALERMRATYGEDIILASMHDRDQGRDPLYCADLEKVLDARADYGCPSANIDRNSEKEVDPYYGSSFESDDISKRVPFGIKDDIERIKKNIPVANIDASYSIDGNILTATADVRFFYSGDASDYSIGYVLTEDGLSSPDWYQTNSLTKNKTYKALLDIEPLFEQWVNGPYNMKNVVYNDVAVAGIGMDTGVEGSIPAAVEDGKIYSHSVQFDLSKNNLIQDRNRLRLITVIINNKVKLLNKVGKIENANSVLVGEKTGIDNVFEKGQAVEKARYAIDGRRISAPVKGINIIKYSDGTLKKEFVR